MTKCFNRVDQAIDCIKNDHELTKIIFSGNDLSNEPLETLAQCINTEEKSLINCFEMENCNLSTNKINSFLRNINRKNKSKLFCVYVNGNQKIHRVFVEKGKANVIFTKNINVNGGKEGSLKDGSNNHANGKILEERIDDSEEKSSKEKKLKSKDRSNNNYTLEEKIDDMEEKKRDMEKTLEDLKNKNYRIKEYQLKQLKFEKKKEENLLYNDYSNSEIKIIQEKIYSLSREIENISNAQKESLTKELDYLLKEQKKIEEKIKRVKQKLNVKKEIKCEKTTTYVNEGFTKRKYAKLSTEVSKGIKELDYNTRPNISVFLNKSFRYDVRVLIDKKKQVNQKAEKKEFDYENEGIRKLEEIQENTKTLSTKMKRSILEKYENGISICKREISEINELLSGYSYRNLKISLNKHQRTIKEDKTNININSSFKSILFGIKKIKKCEIDLKEMKSLVKSQTEKFEKVNTMIKIIENEISEIENKNKENQNRELFQGIKKKIKKVKKDLSLKPTYFKTALNDLDNLRKELKQRENVLQTINSYKTMLMNFKRKFYL